METSHGWWNCWRRFSNIHCSFRSSESLSTSNLTKTKQLNQKSHFNNANIYYLTGPRFEKIWLSGCLRPSHAPRRRCQEFVARQRHQRYENCTRIGHQVHGIRKAEAIYQIRLANSRFGNVRTFCRWLYRWMYLSNYHLST